MLRAATVKIEADMVLLIVARDTNQTFRLLYLIILRRPCLQRLDRLGEIRVVRQGPLLHRLVSHLILDLHDRVHYASPARFGLAHLKILDAPDLFEAATAFLLESGSQGEIFGVFGDVLTPIIHRRHELPTRVDLLLHLPMR